MYLDLVNQEQAGTAKGREKMREGNKMNRLVPSRALGKKRPPTICAHLPLSRPKESEVEQENREQVAHLRNVPIESQEGTCHPCLTPWACPTAQSSFLLS